MEFFDGTTFPPAGFGQLQTVIDKSVAHRFLQNYFETELPKSCRTSFDRFSSKLKGDAKNWFFRRFTGFERNKSKSFGDLMETFRATYAELDGGETVEALRAIHDIITEHNVSIHLLQGQ